MSQAIQETEYPQLGGDVQHRCAHVSTVEPVVLRLEMCGRCGQQFAICRSCYRGHPYCSDACSDAARLDSVREARRRYRQSREALDDHADQERERRQRRRKEALGAEGDGDGQPVPQCVSGQPGRREPDVCVGDHGSARGEVPVGLVAEAPALVDKDEAEAATSHEEATDDPVFPDSALLDAGAAGQGFRPGVPEAPVLRCIVCGRVGRLVVVDDWPRPRRARRPGRPRLPRGP